MKPQPDLLRERPVTGAHSEIGDRRIVFACRALNGRQARAGGV